MRIIVQIYGCMTLYRRCGMADGRRMAFIVSGAELKVSPVPAMSVRSNEPFELET